MILKRRNGIYLSRISIKDFKILSDTFSVDEEHTKDISVVDAEINEPFKAEGK